MNLKQLALAIFSPIVVGLLQYSIWQYISPFAWFLFYPTIFFGARFTGFWGGIISTIVSILIVWYYFLAPQFSWDIANGDNLYSALIFLVMGYLFSDFHERLRRSREMLEKSLVEEKGGRQQAIHLLEEHLALADIGFTQLADSLPQIVWVTRASGENIFFNHSWYQYTGMTEAESIGAGWNKPFHLDDQKKAWDAWQNAVNNNGEYSIECRLRRADGIYRWWLIRGIPSLNAEGNIEKWFGTCTDIHDIKIAQEHLATERINLQTIFENSPSGLAIMRTDGTFLRMNKKYLAYFGVENESKFNNNYYKLMELFDISTAQGQAMPSKNLPGVKAILGEPISSLEICLRDKDNGREWYGIHSSMPIMDEHGVISGAVLSVQDITSSVHDQLRLASIVREQDGILNSGVVGIAKTRARKFLWVNQRFADNYGYGLDELIGQSSEVLYPSQTDYESFGREVQNFNFKNGAWLQDTLQLKRKDGSLGYFLVGGGPLNQSGDESIWISIDVTQSKEDQRLLEAYSERLQHTMEDTLFALSRAVEMRDPYTSGHQQRVGTLAEAIARKMGLEESVAHNLSLIGLVHDIGKIGVPSEILSKPSRLSQLEYDLIKSHVNIGYDILKNVNFAIPVADIVHQHHERFDGSGYPKGLKGDEILLEARIIAVADTVEAMSTHRPYRAALGIEIALQEIEKGRGVKYDPIVVDACLDLFKNDGYQIPIEPRFNLHT